MELDFSIEFQRCTEWCWAAVTAAVCKCYGDSFGTEQCEVASLVLELPSDDCEGCDCQQDPSTDCNQPRNLTSVLNAVKHNRGNPANGHSTLTFEQVQSNINSGHPIVVQVTLNDPAASGHAVAIYGYSDDGLVSVADPMHPDDHITVDFDTFVAGQETSHGMWQAAYLTKRANE